MLDDSPVLDRPPSAADLHDDGGLPAAAFDSLAFQRREDAAVWARAWVAVGFAADVAEAGDILPFTVGHHGIHLERLDDGSLVGRFNKAQHGGCRTVPLQCQTGARTRCSFTACGYSYDRPTIAAAAPDRARQIDQYLGLRPERLLQVDVRQWRPLLLARLDPRGEAKLDWPAPETALRPGGFERGQTAWHECRGNWKQVAVALTEADELGGHASLLYPNVVVRRTRDETCIVLLQPIALGRTLCRIRTASGRPAEVLVAWIAARDRRDGAPTNQRSADKSIRRAFERRVQADVDRLATERRSDVLFRTKDEGEW